VENVIFTDTGISSLYPCELQLKNIDYSDYAAKFPSFFVSFFFVTKTKRAAGKSFIKKRNRHALSLPVSCEEINFIFHKGNF